MSIRSGYRNGKALGAAVIIGFIGFVLCCGAAAHLTGLG